MSSPFPYDWIYFSCLTLIWFFVFMFLGSIHSVLQKRICGTRAQHQWPLEGVAVGWKGIAVVAFVISHLLSFSFLYLYQIPDTNLILHPPVDSAEDQEAESDPPFSEDAVLPIWADLCWPRQAFGWWHPPPGHCWHGEVFFICIYTFFFCGGTKPGIIARLCNSQFACSYAVTVVYTWLWRFCPIQPCFSHICRLKDVQTLEELGDVYNHFLLYYGRDIPKMQNAAKANKKKLKKIKEVSEGGKSRMIN